MNRRRTFRRKIVYLGLIALLFIPISRLSSPATTRDAGGLLAQMRKQDRLSQAQLGKIDPASASMSLATLGMRGVAANLLWGRAHYCQKTENFDGLMAALAQIAKLQPNYVSVWQHQAWNVSYNASVEFDDYRHRYAWVKKGLDFLMEGITYNREEPLLLWDAGWFFGHKLGRSDEYQQFRRLFREDRDFQDSLPIDMELCRGPDSLPDNWKVAHEWFSSAEDVVDRGATITGLPMHYQKEDRAIVSRRNTPLRGKNPLVFHSDPPKALINYADAIEKDGYLDEVSVIAWRNAGQAWNTYGDRPLLSSYGVKIRLNELESRRAQTDKLRQEFEQLLPGLKEKIVEERRGLLSEDERQLLARDPGSLSMEEGRIVAEAQTKLEVRPLEVALAAPPEIREQARKLAMQLEENAEQARIIERYREIVNFENWKQRCQAEQEPNTLEARKLTYQAEQAFAATDLERARQLFEEAWDRWAVFFDRYPVFVEDVEGEVVVESVINYKKLLDQLNETFPPKDFKLMPLVKAYQEEYEELTLAQEPAVLDAPTDPAAVESATPPTTPAGPENP